MENEKKPKEESQKEKIFSIDEALAELRKEKERKFVQTVDLIVNLKKYDPRKQAINTFIQLPNPASKKIAGFLSKKSSEVDTILKEDFEKYKDLKKVKKIAKKYDSFIAIAPLMGEIATKFGRVFGPVGKMPSPQAGIIMNDDDKSVKEMIEKIKKSVRVRTKENSIKISIGKEDFEDSKLKDNFEAAVSAIEKLLPQKNDNIKNVLVKFSMTKSLEVKI